RVDQGHHLAIWWDEENQRLWTSSAPDYTGDEGSLNPLGIYTRKLNSNGTVSDVKGPSGMTGITARRIFGGADKIPAWFQNNYNTGPYVIGFGGYASRMGVGPISLGLTAYAIPDPDEAPASGLFATNQFRV